MSFRPLLPPSPLLSPGCYRAWLSLSLEHCPGRRGLCCLVFLDNWPLIRKLQATCLTSGPLNNKWPVTMYSWAACVGRLTYFTDPVCVHVSVLDFTAASTSDLNQCSSTQASVGVSGAGWWPLSLCLQARAVPILEAYAKAVAGNEYSHAEQGFVWKFISWRI